MIYAVRERPWSRRVEWRLDDDALVRGDGRTFPLRDLTGARIETGASRRAMGGTVVRLRFRRGAAALPSLGFRDRLSPVDQSDELAAFARALLSRAADLAPDARYEAGRAAAPGYLIGAGAILAGGLLLVLAATLIAGFPALGLEIAARLSLPLCLIGAVWPWVSGLGVRRFDPRSIPKDVLA